MISKEALKWGYEQYPWWINYNEPPDGYTCAEIVQMCLRAFDSGLAKGKAEGREEVLEELYSLFNSYGSLTDIDGKRGIAMSKVEEIINQLRATQK